MHFLPQSHQSTNAAMYSRRCIMRASNHPDVINSNSGDSNSDSVAVAQCQQCENAKKIEEDLKRQIEELKSQVAFLKMPCPVNRQNDPNSADILLIATDELDARGFTEPVPVHKSVLVSRSPIFRAMFETNTVEIRNGIILIPDVSPDAMCEFVNYLYRTEASLDYKLANEVLMLAEKYQVMHLKTYCEKYLASKLNRTNSLAIHSFAQQHNARELQAAASAFIARQNRGN